MIFAKRIRTVMMLVAAAAAFTPLQIPFGDRPAIAGAECPTCCKQPGPKCVICLGPCIVYGNAYNPGDAGCTVFEH